MKNPLDNLKVLRAYLSGNRRGKKKDVHGRKYAAVYKEFGHKKMVEEFRSSNTWCIK